MSKKLPIGLVAIGTVIVLFTMLAFTVKPAYYRSGQGVCAHYCYETSEHCAGPESWGTLPCIFGIENECASPVGQSPIDLSPTQNDGSSCIQNDGSDDGSGLVLNVSVFTSNDSLLCL